MRDWLFWAAVAMILMATAASVHVVHTRVSSAVAAACAGDSPRCPPGGEEPVATTGR